MRSRSFFCARDPGRRALRMIDNRSPGVSRAPVGISVFTYYKRGCHAQDMRKN